MALVVQRPDNKQQTSSNCYRLHESRPIASVLFTGGKSVAEVDSVFGRNTECEVGIECVSFCRCDEEKRESPLVIVSGRVDLLDLY